jgi:uncharacterized protein (DUF302 family)
MNRSKNLYMVESEKAVDQFVEDFSAVAEKNSFVINNADSMMMKLTFREHGGEVPDDFDLHMIQVCKPTKADKSLTFNPERCILMPKFVHVFSENGKTQVRFLRYCPEHINEMVPNDERFPESLSQTFETICAMIEEAR